MRLNRANLDPKLIRKCSSDLGQKHRYLIKDLLTGISRRKFDEMDNVAGVYAFWWKGENETLVESLKLGKYYLKGPHVFEGEQRLIPVDFNNDWVEESTNSEDICLYVGKTTSIKHRILGHIRYQTENIWKDKNGDWPKSNDILHGKVKYGFGRKPNSVSQLRIGLERIFQRNAQELIIYNVAVSWIILSDSKVNNSVNRFFIEDKLISEYYPLLNIDIER